MISYPESFSSDELQDQIARERIFAKDCPDRIKPPIKPWPYQPPKEIKPVVFRFSA